MNENSPIYVYDYLGTTCMQCLQKLDNGVQSPRIEFPQPTLSPGYLA